MENTAIVIATAVMLWRLSGQVSVNTANLTVKGDPIGRLSHSAPAFSRAEHSRAQHATRNKAAAAVAAANPNGEPGRFSAMPFPADENHGER